MRMLNESDQNDVEVSWEDQKRINAFSRLNSSYSDVEEEIRIKKEELEALQDLVGELEMSIEEEDVL
ncbi:hypothetical protein IE53DRAFT_322738 [Violaceomyces palustris]|uniref:Uncharacterized protein n=1 Tax=Violaceomyces palustris TaxID=1673888 RepID=A0ACD0NL56_9BASI|nr:hypothetical protein IE53DRAFT_322738 [Violaceomyces palustris]